MNALPFRFTDLYAGLAEGSGLIHDEGTHLCLEFEVKDALAGILKSGVKHVRIPTSDIVSVNISQGWVNTTLVIQTAKLESVQDVPGMNQGRIVLKIARKDREAAEQFVAALHKDGN